MKNILMTEHGTITFDWKKSIWLYMMLIPILFINFSKIKAFDIYFNIIFTFLSVGFGHSVGLHRGIIHKSYTASKLFRKISLHLFVLTGLGSPLSWLKQHYFRDYWQNRKDCLRYFRYQHSLFTDYWWNLHLKFQPKELDRYNIPKEDLNDPLILWLHKTWHIHYITFAITIYFLLGLNGMLMATCLRTSTIILGHWYIGYASHKYGYSRHIIKDADESGYNDIFLGLISFGEGFHNNHHAFPTSAKFSSKLYEIDFGWMLVWILSKLNIIKNVNTQKNNLKTKAIKHQNVNWKFPKI